MCGFESFDVLDSKGRLTIDGTTSLFSKQTGRDGVGSCLRIARSASTTHQAYWSFNAHLETFIFGFSFHTTHLPNSAQILVQFRNQNDGNQVYMWLTATGQLLLNLSSSSNALNLGTSTETIAINTWVTIEVKATISNTGSLTVRLNGVPLTNLDNLTGVDTYGSGAADVASVLLKVPSNGGMTGGYVSFDDFYVCDTTGSINNDFLGDVRVHTRMPDGDATPNQFTAVGAGTDKWERVDESPDDEDTTYLHTATVGHEERFGFPDLPAGVTTVLGVQALAVVRKEDAGTRTVRNVITGSSATDADGATTGLASGYTYIADIFETDPGTSAAWTKANADAIIAGLEIVA